MFGTFSKFGLASVVTLLILGAYLIGQDCGPYCEEWPCVKIWVKSGGNWVTRCSIYTEDKFQDPEAIHACVPTGTSKFYTPFGLQGTCEEVQPLEYIRVWPWVDCGNLCKMGEPNDPNSQKNSFAIDCTEGEITDSFKTTLKLCQ